MSPFKRILAGRCRRNRFSAEFPTNLNKEHYEIFNILVFLNDLFVMESVINCQLFFFDSRTPQMILIIATLNFVLL